MTEIEEKALALVNEVRAERGYSDVQTYPADRKFPPFEALCRAIEQHEWLRAEVKAQYHRGYYDGHNAAREIADD